MTDIINWTIFDELVLMDEDEPGFSKSLIQTFIEQAVQTFEDIEVKLSEIPIDLNSLSQSGHYLKGSAASLGLIKIQEQCEKIQNYGLQKDFDGGVNGRDWGTAIREALNGAREEFIKARYVLSDYYKEQL
jgi:osomolarity two-component system phosphorelay intermediate protein YPD1